MVQITTDQEAEIILVDLDTEGQVVEELDTFEELEGTIVANVSKAHVVVEPIILATNSKHFKTPRIQTFKLETSMGNTRTELPFLNAEQVAELDTIGYTGKTSLGKKTSRQSYLNSLGIGEFSVEQTKWDNGDFTEEFLIVWVKD